MDQACSIYSTQHSNQVVGLDDLVTAQLIQTVPNCPDVFTAYSVTDSAKATPIGITGATYAGGLSGSFYRPHLAGTGAIPGGGFIEDLSIWN